MFVLFQPERDAMDDGQHQECEQRSECSSSLASQTDCDADSAREPKPRSCCKSLDFGIIRTFQNGSSSNKTHAANNALDNTAQIARRHASLLRYHNEEGRTKRDE